MLAAAQSRVGKNSQRARIREGDGGWKEMSVLNHGDSVGVSRGARTSGDLPLEGPVTTRDISVLPRTTIEMRCRRTSSRFLPSTLLRLSLSSFRLFVRLHVAMVWSSGSLESRRSGSGPGSAGSGSELELAARSALAVDGECAECARWRQQAVRGDEGFGTHPLLRAASWSSASI